MKAFAPLAAAYVALVVLANWLAAKYVITVPFTHHLAPAGVLCVGFVLVMRDWLQQLRGLRVTFALILGAGILSYVTGLIAGYGSLQRIALASLIAFIVSEGIVETAIFSPLRKRYYTLGVALSASLGNLIDSYIFLVLAFPAIWTALYAGNVVGKFEMVAVGVVLTAVRRKAVPVAA